METMEMELNARLRVLHIAMQTGGNPEIYATRVHKAAARVHESILQVCSAGFEVEAHKDNRSILRFEAAGPLKRTRFQYSRNRFTVFPDQFASEFDECDLLVIGSFTLRQSTLY